MVHFIYFSKLIKTSGWEAMRTGSLEKYQCFQYLGDSVVSHSIYYYYSCKPEVIQHLDKVEVGKFVKILKKIIFCLMEIKFKNVIYQRQSTIHIHA